MFVQPASVPPISQLGPDALLEPMSLDEFADSLNKKKNAIKALLLDQVANCYGFTELVLRHLLKSFVC